MSRQESPHRLAGRLERAEIDSALATLAKAGFLVERGKILELSPALDRSHLSGLRRVRPAITSGRDGATDSAVRRRAGAQFPRVKSAWRVRDTQVLIRTRERFLFTPTEIAAVIRRPEAEVEDRVAELIESGELHPQAGAGRQKGEHRGLQFWNSLRPAIREMYEDGEPHRTIEFMLGIRPTELGSQLHRLFKEGLTRRDA